MAGLLSKVANFFSVGRDDEQDENDSFYTEDYEEDTYEEPVRSAPRSFRGKKETNGSNIVSLPQPEKIKMIIYHPVNYDDAKYIVDNLRCNKPVVVDLENVEVTVAQRILDFLFGATCALKSDIQKVTRGIYIVAPSNYDVIGNGDGEFSDLI